MSPKRLWFVTHCLACRYLSVFWMQRSWQCWGVLLENTANVCTHATGTEQEPIFLVWRATGEVLQMERSEWCITISAWLSSVGVFILWRVFFWWKSQILPCSCFGRDSALFSRTKVSRYNAHVLSSIVTIKGFVKVLRSLQYMVCRITQTSLFSCWRMMGACFQTFSWRHFFCHVITPRLLG